LAITTGNSGSYSTGCTPEMNVSDRINCCPSDQTKIWVHNLPKLDYKLPQPDWSTPPCSGESLRWFVVTSIGSSEKLLLSKTIDESALDKTKVLPALTEHPSQI
jgi:hypothetical protein